jgi:hypothetical protein
VNEGESEISRMFRRIAKAERHIAKGVRVEEENSRIARLKEILKGLGVSFK